MFRDCLGRSHARNSICGGRMRMTIVGAGLIGWILLHPPFIVRMASLLASCLPTTGHAGAGPVLIAVGHISGATDDMAAETAGPLESGVPGNRLGGVGSGLAHAGGNTFLAIPDRGIPISRASAIFSSIVSACASRYCGDVPSSSIVR